MEFRHGSLPDDHVFLFAARPLVDWTFKAIAWTGAVATLQIAAEVTSSWMLWITWLTAIVMLFFFFQTFID